MDKYIDYVLQNISKTTIGNVFAISKHIDFYSTSSLNSNTYSAKEFITILIDKVRIISIEKQDINLANITHKFISSFDSQLPPKLQQYLLENYLLGIREIFQKSIFYG